MKNISYNIYKKVVQRQSTPSFWMNVVHPAILPSMLRPTLTYAEKGHILVSGISYEVLAIFSWPLCKGLFFLIESFLFPKMANSSDDNGTKEPIDDYTN